MLTDIRSYQCHGGSLTELNTPITIQESHHDATIDLLYRNQGSTYADIVHTLQDSLSLVAIVRSVV